MTGNEYVESMRKLNLQVYMFGEKIEHPVDDPNFKTVPEFCKSDL